MKTAFVSLLAAAGVSLSACGHMAEETAALNVEETRAELASVTAELNTISVALEERARQRRARTGVATGTPATGSNVVAASTAASSTPRRVIHRPLERMETLLVRQAELKAKMDRAGAFTADEIRGQIQQIDTKLATYHVDNVPSIQGPSFTPRETTALMPVMSSGPRATAWSTRQQLTREREKLHARLQDLETSQN